MEALLPNPDELDMAAFEEAVAPREAEREDVGDREEDEDLTLSRWPEAAAAAAAAASGGRAEQDFGDDIMTTSAILCEIPATLDLHSTMARGHKI
jgi:hypothetical protein